MRVRLLSAAVALLLCASHSIRGEGQDTEVLSAAIAHYSNSKSAPLLVVASETIEATRISLGRFERAETTEIPASIIRELRSRNAKARPIANLQLPANAILVRDAISMTRHFTPAGTEVAGHVVRLAMDCVARA